MGIDAKTLAERITGELPAGIAALSVVHQQFLADAIGATLRQQGQELDAAAENGLRLVPRVLRNSVRKAVGR